MVTTWFAGTRNLRNADWIKGVALLHVGHILMLLKMNHKTVLRMRMSIGYLEPLVTMTCRFLNLYKRVNFCGLNAFEPGDAP